MKKFLVFIAAMVVAALSLSSCNKDDNKGGESLVGTTWVTKIISNRDSDGKEEYGNIFIHFDDASNCRMYSDFDDEELVVKGTYKYSAPSISMTFTNLGESITMSGNVDGNKMTVNDPEQPSVAIIFTKK